MRMRSVEMIRASRGFTLIEVLAALIIVSLGMLGVIQAVGQTASNSSYLRERTLAHWVAMNKLTDVRLQPNAPKIDKSSDEVEMAGRRWRWTMTVTQTPVESMRRIDISVRPDEAAEGSQLASVTGFYGSAVAPAGSTLVSWQGSQDGPGGQQDSDQNREEQQRPPKQDPPAEPPDNGDGQPEPPPNPDS